MTIRGGGDPSQAWLQRRPREWACRPGAAPPMRITASWSRSVGPTEYKCVARVRVHHGELGVGDKLEPNKGQAVKAGGYFHMPQGMQHYMSFPEETVFQANGNGPAGINYVNSADDPRKTN